MKPAPIPENDQQRLDALADYEVLATTPETWFDNIVKVAAQLCGTPIALVTLVGREDQFFKAAQGLPADRTCSPRANSFCGHAILEQGVFEIPDTLDDERFHDNPWVTGEYGIRFYAGAPLLNGDGIALGTVCVLDRQPGHLSDEQKQALQSLASVIMQHIELRRSESFGQHLGRIIETSDYFVAVLDATDYRVLHINDSLEKLLTTSAGPPSPHELRIQTLFPSLDDERLESLAAQDPETASPTDLVAVSMFGAGKQESVVHLRITPSRVRERAVLLLVAEDMGKLLSSNQQAERAASELRKLALVARLTDNPVIITDAEDYIEWVNPSFETLTGYKQEDVIGKRPGAFLQGPGTDDEARRRIAKAIQSGESVRQEILNYDRRGRVYWLDLDIQPVYDQRDTLTNFVAIQTDITQRKELETHLRRARDEAEASNQAKSQFLANISHELRTPLNGIIGIAELLGRNPARPDLPDQLNTLRDSANGLLSIINDLLDLSKIEARSLELEYQPFSLKDLLRNLENLFLPQAREKGIDLAVSVVDGVPDHFLGDSLRLKQVLMNLLGNGIKFTDSGAVQLRIEAPECTGEIVNLAFSVSDSGPGIPETIRGRIFEPFGQADASLARRYGGTGLGLTICQRLVALMGGELRLDSTEGEGACFHFTLNLQVASPAEVEALAAQGSGRWEESPVKACRILLVDDNSINRRVGAAMLDELGATVTSSDSGSGAIAAFEADDFDLVLLDIQMPDMNGYDVAIRLRELDADRNRETPILAVTAHSAPALEMNRQHLMDGYIAKPLTFQGLQAALRQSLSGEQPRTDEGPAITNPMPEDQPLIDEDLVMRNLNRDPGLIATLVNLFEQQHAQYLELIDTARTNGDMAMLADAAHSLKGAVGYFTGGSLWRQVADLEQAARKGEVLSDDVERVRAGVLELAEAVRSFTPGQS